MASLSATLTPEPDAHKITVYHVNESKVPDGLLPVDDSIVTLVVRCIKICQSMLDTPHVQGALESIVLKYSKERPKAWFLDGLDGPVTQDTAVEVTNNFLDKIRARFPYIFVDDSWGNSSTLGHHWRVEHWEEFESRDQYISLNGRVSGEINAEICLSKLTVA